MDSPSTGDLLGATFDEAWSWGKLTKEARNVTVLGDTTVHLPLIMAVALSALMGGD